MPPRNPVPTVDVVVETEPGTVILVERANAPFGWALPGGFVDYGETLAEAARREAREEIGLDVSISELFHCYSDPSRDRRLHTLSAVFLATAQGEPIAGDDAAACKVFALRDLPPELCFDHGLILADYARYRQGGERPPPSR